MEAPTLQTDRLTLRPQTMEDWPAYWELMKSGRSKYMGGPYSKSATWGLFCHDAAQWHLLGHGALMIDLTETGACIGQVGINHGPLFPEREIGWLLYAGNEGHGYAFEAAKAFRDWAQNERRLDSLVSYVDSDNTRSITLAQRLGAWLDPDAKRHCAEDLVYRHW